MCLEGILIYYSIICGEAFQGIFFGLNTDKRNSLVICCKELTLSSGRDSYPITGSENNFFSVNNDFSFAGKDTVNFLVVLMRVYERNISSCRKIVDTDFCTCERKCFMKFCSAFISNICFCVICHGTYLRF